MRFKTRRQTLNTMGAQTRVVIDWTKRLVMFHKMLGKNIEAHPEISPSSYLNYYSLLNHVLTLGVHQKIEDLQLWIALSNDMGFPQSTSKIKSVPQYLKKTYCEIIVPFVQHLEFLESTGLRSGHSKLPIRSLNKTPVSKSDDSKYKLSYIKLFKEEHPVNPYLSIPHIPRIEFNQTKSVKKNEHKKPSRKRTISKSSDSSQSNDRDADEDDSEYVAICEVCNKGCFTDNDLFIDCKECEESFHLACIKNKPMFFPRINSKFSSSPDSPDDWVCPKCLVGTYDFGFEPGDTYSMDSFEDFASDFEEDYMTQNPELIELSSEEAESALEKQFWRYVNSTGDSLTVEYGSDIQDTSGFPTRVDTHNKYSKDSWNLNNMPLHKNSLFHHINSDISGMTVPWLYIGMMFSTFCWHSEDHYTYSVNYQHFGATKTWYGIPESYAEAFEKAVRELTPELFEKQPRILSQLVTMISPDLLLKKNVPCYAVNQHPGEFVITFPKAYHSGFNHGYNCNEAVNFAPPDWLPYGAESVKSYQQVYRAPVFSFDRLMIKTAICDKRQETAKWFFPQFKKMIDDEIGMRIKIMEKFPLVPIYINSNEISEEDYQCCVCSSLPYMSRFVVRPAGTAPRDVRLKPYYKDNDYPWTKNKTQTESKPASKRGRPPKNRSETPQKAKVAKKRGRPRKSQEPPMDLEGNSPKGKQSSTFQFTSERSLKKYIQNLVGIKDLYISDDEEESDEDSDGDSESINLKKREQSFSSVVCPLHIPEKLESTLMLEFHLKFTNKELLELAYELEQRLF